MQRAIDGYHQDGAGAWVAELRCGHRQHVRDPRVDSELACGGCDRFELPAGHTPYKRTREFDELSIPDGLRKDHATKAGVWGVIHVLAGRLRYVVEPPLPGERLLVPGVVGIVVPEVLHRVVPEGAVRFFVEFHRAPPAPA